MLILGNVIDEPLTRAQRRELWVHWARLGLGDARAERLAVCSRLLGCAVESTTALDGEQAQRLLVALRACRTRAELDAAGGQAAPALARPRRPRRRAPEQPMLPLDLPGGPRPGDVLAAALADAALLAWLLGELCRIAPDIHGSRRR